MCLLGFDLDSRVGDLDLEAEDFDLYLNFHDLTTILKETSIFNHQYRINLNTANFHPTLAIHCINPGEIWHGKVKHVTSVG